MPQERNAFKVGIVTISIVVVFFVVLIWISQRIGGEMQPITVRFDATSAMPTLVRGSAVLVGGHKVGKVLEVDLTKRSAAEPESDGADDAYCLIVHAEIRSDLELKSDCKVVAEGPPLGGDGLIKIDLGSAPEPIPPGRIIEGSQPAGFGAILATLQSEFNGEDPRSLLGRIKSQLDPDAELSLVGKILLSLDDINRVTAGLDRELQPDQKATLLAKLHEVADNINEATGSLRAQFDAGKPSHLLGKIHLAMDTINDGLTTLARMLEANETPLARTLHNVETATDNIARETDAANADSLMAHFKQASLRLNASLADINSVTDTTRQVVALNRENVNKLLANFKESSDHIKTGVKHLLLHPWRLFNEPTAAEAKVHAVVDAARNFSEAARQIDDATTQLRVLAELHEGNIPADHPDLARIAADLNRTRSKYNKAEAALWQQLGVN